MPNLIACTECNDCEGTARRPATLTKDLSGRLNRIEGQVRGVKSMLEKGTYCDDVLTQISAVQSAMSSVAKILLESHMRTCVAKRLQSGDEAVIDEFIKTIGRLL